MTLTAALPIPTREHPDGVLESIRKLQFVCPLCRDPVIAKADCYSCEPCKRIYPLHAGIPDFRVFRDPYLDFEEDRKRTELVLEAIEQSQTFEELLERYWSLSDITPPPLRAKYIRNAMLGEARAKRVLEILQNGTFDSRIHAQRVLDVGAGTGNFLIAAAGKFELSVGVDIGMRWLQLSRRRFMDQNLPIPPLVCCCAEHLPFAEQTFDLVVCSSTLEFAQDQQQLFAEASRVLDTQGHLFISTVNRYSIAVNPYVYLWGVGFLPRHWQARYVRWRKGASYEHVRLLSLRELLQLGIKLFPTSKIALPDVDNSSFARLPLLTRLQVQLYRLLRRLPLSRSLLRWVGPQWDALFGKQPGKRES